MGLFDFLKRKPMDTNGSIDEQMKREAEAQMQETQSHQSMESSISGSFLMIVEDVFTITGRGTVVTGRIERGNVRLNDVVKLEPSGKNATVNGIEMFRKALDYAQAGNNIGLFLREVSRDEVSRGTRIVK